MEINAINISKRYQDLVVDQFSYKFKSNKVYFIIGESGVGKTTLIKMLGGYLKPDEGEIYYNKVNLNDIDIDALHRSIVTYINQDSSLLSYLTINQNIDYLINKKIDQHYSKKCAKYSGGEKRRISVYLGSLKDSEVVLADEISASLDKENAIKVMSYLRQICQNKILIIVSHDLFLIKQDDIVINLEEKHQAKQKTNNKKLIIKKKRLPFYKKWYYSLLKIFDSKKYLSLFVSSFMVGIMLLLLSSSLKSGITDFINKQMLKDYNHDYLLLYREEPFFYGEEEQFNNISKGGTILGDKFFFDLNANLIYFPGKQNIYLKFSDNYQMSKGLYKYNGYHQQLYLDQFKIYCSKITSEQELILYCPYNFIKEYYLANDYLLSDLFSNYLLLDLKNSDQFINDYQLFLKQNNMIEIRSIGIDVNNYLANLLNKINLILNAFAFLALVITFFLVNTVIQLDLKNDYQENTFLFELGHSFKDIFLFYLIVNLYRGIITYFLTVIMYFILILITNNLLKKALNVFEDILIFDYQSLIMSFIIIVVIVMVATILNSKNILKNK